MDTEVPFGLTVGGHEVKVLCTTHGAMKYRFSHCQWECVGFDGEGCPARLTDKEMCHILDGQPIQRATDGELSWQHVIHVDRVEVTVTPNNNQVVTSYTWTE